MILIVTKNNIEYKDALVIKDTVYLKDEYTIIYNNQEINFDYLITDDINMVSNLKEYCLFDGVIVTNWFLQTSLEHIYFGDCLTCLENLLES